MLLLPLSLLLSPAGSSSGGEDPDHGIPGDLQRGVDEAGGGVQQRRGGGRRRRGRDRGGHHHLMRVTMMVEIALVDVGVGGPGTLGVHRAGIVSVLRWDLLVLLLMIKAE